MRVAKGIEVELVRLLMLVNIWASGTRMYRDPIKALRATKQMVSIFSKASRGIKVKQAFVIDSKYSWDMFNPHWPSKAFNRFYKAQLREYVPVKENPLVLRRILVAITKKCPLRCEHCSEWDTLNEKDHLSLKQYEEYLDAFVRDGVAQIVYSGGEPLNRFNDLVALIHRYRKNTNQWIYTSGYNLSLEKAQQLKNAGLNGVSISLDHHLEEAHNLFRGNAKSFNWVEKAIKNCKEANLLVSINTCITKKYLQQNGLNSIVDLAKEWEVPIVNILEPRAVGHYAQKDVEYSIAEKQMVEKQVLALNQPTNTKLPFVQYPAMLRSGMPCGGGRSYLLLDSDGTLRPCPFCKTPISKPSIETNNCEADALAYS